MSDLLRTVSIKALLLPVCVALQCVMSVAAVADTRTNDLTNSQPSSVATASAGIAITKLAAPTLPTSRTIIGTNHGGFKVIETLCLNVDSSRYAVQTESFIKLDGESTGSNVLAAVSVTSTADVCSPSSVAVRIDLAAMQHATVDQYTGDLSLTVVAR